MLTHKIIFTLKESTKYEVAFDSIPEEYFYNKKDLVDPPLHIFPTLEIEVVGTRKEIILVCRVINIYYPSKGTIIYSNEYRSSDYPSVFWAFKAIIDGEVNSNTLDTLCWDIVRATFFKDKVSEIYFPEIRNRLDSLDKGGSG